ncbi:MAG: SsrA-binding protein SmpB [Planctomycetota bacterium]|nr:SsrA-binding protein SmpB [Planctomycetota bacterium]
MSPKGKLNTNDRVIENRKARFEYHIIDTLECGIALHGSEVKTIRDGEVSLAEGYVRATAEPPTLIMYSVNIGDYGPAGAMGHKRTRARTLLAHKREIVKLARASDVKGMTIVPLKIYFKDGWAKVLIGLGEGKAKHDKRQSIAKCDADRDIARAMSRRR